MRRRIALSVLVASTMLGWPSTAVAAVSSEVDGDVLRVTGTDGIDVIGIRCDGGDVMVNDRNPGTGAFACSDLSGIVVDANAGSDVLYMDQVIPLDFPGVSTIRVNGGGGNDTFKGTPGDDELSGGDGNDRFYASGGSDDLSASTGDDLLIIEALGDVTLTDTSLTTIDGTSTVSGFEDGHFTMLVGGGLRFDASGFRGNTVMEGERGADRLIGAAGRDFINAGGGADRVVGNGGDDYINGEGGPDVLLAGPGNDRIFGGPGNDRCRGGPGDNLIYDC
jgi:Ca2+-binding RTX toxin-like protein